MGALIQGNGKGHTEMRDQILQQLICYFLDGTGVGRLCLWPACKPTDKDMNVFESFGWGQFCIFHLPPLSRAPWSGHEVRGFSLGVSAWVVLLVGEGSLDYKSGCNAHPSSNEVFLEQGC